LSNASQRRWRAACPNCGAPVEFLSAASTSAVCSFCRSTLVRDGETLRRIGQSAELFDDHSPLQLGTTGQHQGQTFTLIGRLQYAYAEGTWNEWHALFDSGRSGWLSEDNGQYVLSFDVAEPGAVPPAESLRPGARAQVAGLAWQVASVVQARLLAAQGELPRAPSPRLGEFTVVDLRNAQGDVATLDYSVPSQASVSVGRSASLGELALKGLRDASEKTLRSRGVNCPQCGSSLEIQLASTQSLSCGQCHALVDVSSEAGAAVQSVQQTARPPPGQEPRLPLGRAGRLPLEAAGTVIDWQVVGYQVREDLPDDGERPTPWGEYLLYNLQAGFAFLVDTSDGWSLVRPLTGAPEVRAARAVWQGATYRESYTYRAQVVWVEGEFYWRVQRQETALVTDYIGEGAAGGRLLSREQVATEVTWSGGRQLSADEVSTAFALPGLKATPVSFDVKPVTSSGGMSFVTLLVIFLLLMVVLSVVSRCSRDDCDDIRRAFGANSPEYQQCVRSGGSGRIGGGSYGGYSSGGGHK